MSTDSVQTSAFGRDTAVRELLRPLEPFFRLQGVTEIVINRPGEVMFEQGADWHTQTVSDLSAERLNSLVRAIATFTDQDIGPRHPILSAILPDGQRVQIVVPPAVAPETISLSIRLPSGTIRALDDYETEGAFDRFVWAVPDSTSPALATVDRELVAHLAARNLKAFLTSAVKGRRNMAIVGDTGSGKTTLMKSLCQHIPPDERIVTIEDVREIDLPSHRNKVHLLYSKGGQGVAKVTPADLIAANMRMRPDRVLLAELRGSESFDFLKLLTTGHSGSITSYHAESCALAFERYVLMAKEHPNAAIFDAEGLKRLVTLTLDIVVHMRSEIVTLTNGERRKLRFVSEVHYDPVAKLDTRFGVRQVTTGPEAVL
ncbi:P-type DNA transfer ATPase VirB11 [Asticcacaulis tiandongensis]|uniref:P-type DNA transfer ATPase VirB11 n=1 Tax=Asticcacaulis tiandongensis TaxID=2565365 RepID=UPI001128E258|nr:P-type DNA transfer ATPase VirB11 [Asticcacaulis tiandongensis]